jgi:hypothetical protein
VLIVRTSCRKIILDRQLPDFGVQPFDLALRLCLGFLADPGVKGPGGVLRKLLLPGIDLVRVNLIALRCVLRNLVG